MSVPASLFAMTCRTRARTVGFRNQKAQKEVNQSKPILFDKGGTPFLVHAYGPAELISQGDNLYRIARNDCNTVDQLRFALKHARQLDPNVQIRIRFFPRLAVFWYENRYAPLPEGLPSRQDFAKADVVTIHDEDKLIDDTNLDLKGMAVQTALEQMEVGLGDFWKKYLNVQAALLRIDPPQVKGIYTAHDWAEFEELTKPSPESFENREMLVDEINEIIRLGITWRLKYEFYLYYHASLAANIKYPLMKVLKKREDDPEAQSRYMLKRFQKLYRGAPYELNPILIEMLWKVAPPRLMEHGLQFPNLLEALFKKYNDFTFDPHDKNDPFFLLERRLHLIPAAVAGGV
jgi:hypothetical protein